MGFLDKLLGRGKDVAETAGDTTKEYGGKAKDVAEDTGDKAKDVFDDTKDRVSGGDEGSDTTQSEQRLDDVRDQVLKDEGRTP